MKTERAVFSKETGEITLGLETTLLVFEDKDITVSVDADSSITINNELFLLEEIVKRNFAAKYKDSVLGILWSFLNPLITMVLLTAIFSTFFTKS